MTQMHSVYLGIMLTMGTACSWVKWIGTQIHDDPRRGRTHGVHDEEQHYHLRGYCR